MRPDDKCYLCRTFMIAVNLKDFLVLPITSMDCIEDFRQTIPGREDACMFSLCRNIMLPREVAYVQSSETRLTEKCQDVSSVTPAVPN